MYFTENTECTESLLRNHMLYTLLTGPPDEDVVTHHNYVLTLIFQAHETTVSINWSFAEVTSPFHKQKINTFHKLVIKPQPWR